MTNFRVESNQREMKSLSPAIIFVLMISLLWSCGESQQTIEEEPELMEEEAAIEEEVEELDISTIHVVYFSTPDYAHWRQAYRDATNDENLLGVFENMNEPGQYMVAERNDGNEEQKEFFESEQFQAMLEASNAEVSRIEYMDARYGGDGSGIPYRLGIAHEVADFAVWSQKFWDDQERREMAGIKTIALSTDAFNPSMVYVWLGINDVEQAREMINTEETKRTMDEAGVISAPETDWWKPAESLN